MAICIRNLNDKRRKGNVSYFVDYYQPTYNSKESKSPRNYRQETRSKIESKEVRAAVALIPQPHSHQLGSVSSKAHGPESRWVEEDVLGAEKFGKVVQRERVEPENRPS